MRRRSPIPRRPTTASASNAQILSLVAQLPPEAFARYKAARGAGMSVKEAYAAAFEK